MKPISTLRKALRSVDINTKEEELAAFERSDVTAVPAAGVIGEAMVSLVLALCAAGLPAAARAKSTDEVLNLAPARAEGAVARGISVGPFTLSNRMREAYDVAVFPTLLGQRRDGSLFARSDPAARSR